MSVETANAILNEPRQLPRILGTMQSEIAGQAAQSEFANLQSINNKRASEL